MLCVVLYHANVDVVVVVVVLLYFVLILQFFDVCRFCRYCALCSLAHINTYCLDACVNRFTDCCAFVICGANRSKRRRVEEAKKKQPFLNLYIIHQSNLLCNGTSALPFSHSTYFSMPRCCCCFLRFCQFSYLIRVFSRFRSH